ncbi:sentrin-specific protease 1-like [Olea europaea subsp. europaea]|uniref:Sentrin-specific protease 1-like n=1 Tax=Olea europaea subsp. europaea TaxID=158383 RepID=A0A8S0U2A6_OLEEU|nr:sentrin-specific protease 1-like [Olea europaea subsp. europaea]
MDPPMELDKTYVDSPKDEGLSAHMSPHYAADTIGIEPYVRVIPHLMGAIGLWNKDPDNDKGDSMELRIVLGYDVPQQQNGHDCSIFAIKYAEYYLHNELESMPKEFDAAKLGWM